MILRCIKIANRLEDNESIYQKLITIINKEGNLIENFLNRNTN